MGAVADRWLGHTDQGGWLSNATVLTPSGRLKELDLAVVAGRIAELAPRSPERHGWDCTGLLIIPGLANAHFHGASTLLRGLNAGLQLADWGDDSPAGREQARLFGWLDEQASDDDIRTLASYEYLEQLRQGVTFIADDGLAEGGAPALAAAMAEVGVRGVVNAHEQAADLVAADPDRYLVPLPDEDELTSESLSAAAGFAERFGAARLATHCLETQPRWRKVLAEFGRSTVQVFAQAGLLRRGTVLYHCVHADDADLQTLAAAGTGLVHCPVSNLFGGEIAGTSQWLRYGLTAGIGTDFGRTDLWEAVRLAYLLLRRQSGPAASALDILGWATAGGQRAYGYADRGRVDPGAAADLVLLDLGRLRPMVDRPDLSTAAYAVIADTRPSSVRHVLIGGRPVLTDGEPVLVAADGVARRRHDLVHRLGG
jgi:5-methylthioadenosine/S-adenosylhomocysteine deaminase